MNKALRERIDGALQKLAEIQAEIEEIRDAEQESFDNLPESLQESERGQAMEGNIECLDEALDACETMDTALTGAKDGQQ